MLMHNASLIFPGTMVMTVHNQYPDIELVSPMYFFNRCIYNEYPLERTDTGAIMKIEFRYDLDQDKPRGILMYKAQRKTRSNHRASIDKLIEDALETMRLLVTWKIECSGELKVNIMLVEYGDEIVLNEDKLAQLYEKVNDIPSSYISRHTWLMYDNTVLMVVHKVVQKVILELDITIFEEPSSIDIIRPMWIDLSRQVSSEVAIYTIIALLFNQQWK
jgi:hypothetical protein